MGASAIVSPDRSPWVRRWATSVFPSTATGSWIPDVHGSRAIPTQLIDNRRPVDKAVLVGAPDREVPPRLAEEHLLELARLTDTAGGQVAGFLRQRIDSPHPRYYIGDGKAEELAEMVKETGADLVIFDEELTPAQGKNLESRVGVRVMDRPELILDIFATRARSREARMQVELAQLQYLLPRLKRMWSHLSRTRGGIGLRGPGETQLETDRRLIGTRISALRRQLKDVAAARETQRKSRQGSFRAALVGYTNAGKSSLLRALSGADVLVEDRLFATLDSTTRSVELEAGLEALLTDTVGFIRKLPHHLVASFRSTLEEAREADVLLHVVDASHPDREEHEEVVREVLEDLDLHRRPQLLVYNKIDRLTHDEEQALRDRVRALSPAPAVFVSAHQPETLEALKAALLERLRARLATVRLTVPARAGDVLAALHREGEVLSQEARGTTIEVTARVPEALLGRLRARPNVEISEVP
ncbi:MAG TPA: GTPase HflX [Longimicrobiales bacterium]|nr:GTPase HflX [Longimicrobiales bacterium]